jgi:hypothetical protein
MSAQTFRALHHGPTSLVLPNVWDPVSARVVAEAGYPAIATSSGAVARVIGFDDGQLTPPAEMFEAVRRIAAAVDIPVTADMEAGYGLPAKEFVDRLLEAGAVGCNLEDSVGGVMVEATKARLRGTPTSPGLPASAGGPEVGGVAAHLGVVPDAGAVRRSVEEAGSADRGGAGLQA